MEFPKSPDRIFLGIRAELELWWTARARVGLNQETGTASWLLTTPHWSDEKRMSPAIDPDHPANEYHPHHSR